MNLYIIGKLGHTFCYVQYASVQQELQIVTW